VRVIVTSILAAVLLALGAGVLLSLSQKPVYQAEAPPSVRIGDPGHNLVGPDWSGLYKSPPDSRRVTQADTGRE
jgi:hypothetical protein